MALNLRQRKTYTDTWDFYAESAGGIGADRHRQPLSFPTTPTYAAVKCRFYSTNDFENPSLLGQITESNIMTQDRLHVDQAQAASNGWIVRNMTPSHPEYGKYWEIQGDPKVVNSHGRVRTNFKEIYLKEGIPAAGMP